MSMEYVVSWSAGNQKYLMDAVRAVRARLEEHPAETLPDAEATNLTPAPALEQLCAAFGLSTFERDVLVMCAGVELDSGFAQLVASVQKSGRSAPTFGLALAALREPHWSALSPAASLRRWRLIDVGPGEGLTASPLRIDERVLHFLAGAPSMDERLRGLVDYVAAPSELLESQRTLAHSVTAVWSVHRGFSLPVIHLCGEDADAKRAVASAACAELGNELQVIAAAAVPHAPAELDAFVRLWQRETLLARCALLVEFEDGEVVDAARAAAIQRLLEETQGLLLTSRRTPYHVLRRESVTFEVPRPTPQEQNALWRKALGSAAGSLNGALDVLGAQFSFGALQIRDACARAMQEPRAHGTLDEALWDACRIQARPATEGLAQRVVPAATWEDLVLPAPQLQLLREIAVHVRQRTRVYETWGFGSKGARGLGISALFAGPSGTGKTMAAEVLANELRLDLHVCDLSQVVSKYIGETEKNLRRVFDAAERGGGILLFDEADALFGKRSEVKDSHDRYANVEISYLLQRMEAFRGLAILTSNMKSALDTAFIRRIRFIVQFPFPEQAQRAEIWRRVFPAATPTRAVDCVQLARLQVAGGNIRNIALHAAFLAADSGGAVTMNHLIRAARGEYAKLERPLTDAEIGEAR